MRKALFPVAAVAVACVVSVIAQQDPARERDVAPSGTQSRRSAPAPGEPPEMELGSRLEWFVMRPARAMIRDTWRVGAVECKPWDNSPGGEGTLRVNAVVAHIPGQADERAAGLELVLRDEFGDHTFMFDDRQIGDLQIGLETLRTTAETMRDPAQDVARRVTFNLNGLEIGMSARRAGGYLAPVGPDAPSVGLNPDNFEELKRLIAEAQTILKREAATKERE